MRRRLASASKISSLHRESSIVSTEETNLCMVELFLIDYPARLVPLASKGMHIRPELSWG